MEFCNSNIIFQYCKGSNIEKQESFNFVHQGERERKTSFDATNGGTNIDLPSHYHSTKCEELLVKLSKFDRTFYIENIAANRYN